MADFERKLQQLSKRGTPVGAEELIERIEAELAGDPLVVVTKQREGVLMTNTDQPVPTKGPGPGRGFGWALVAFVAVLTVGGLYFAFSGDDDEVVDQVAVPTPTTVPEPTVIVPWGGPGPRAHVTVMLLDGWEVADGFVVKADADVEPSDPPDTVGRRSFIRVGSSVVANIYSEPCNSTLLDPPVGPTVDDLATAFADVWGTNATTPTEVTLDGFVGKQMVLTVPADVDFADCFDGHYMAWHIGGADRSFQGPGQIQESWIVDVEGERLLIEASYFPEISPENRAELQQVIDSIQIEPE